MSLSIVLTCYNEVPLIFESYRTLSRVVQAAEIEHEFIVVDDGSSEEAQRALQGFLGDTTATLVLSERNEGRGAAVTRGIGLATKEYVCFIDTDLEVPAEAVPLLYEAAVEQSADMVIAERIYTWDLRPTNLIRNFGSIAIRRLSSVMLGVGSLDTETGAKAFKRSSIAKVLEGVSDTRWFWDTEIVAEALRHSQRVTQVPVTVRRRSDKKTSVRLLRDALAYLRAAYAYRRRTAASRRSRSAAE